MKRGTCNWHTPIQRDRRFRTRVGQELSDTHLQDEGVPQGSVLSFTLFSLAINNITSNLPRDIQSSPYVDDLVIYLTSNYLPSVERPQQHVINCISTWASNHGFTISENKTIAVHFNRKRRHAEPSLSLNNSNIHFLQAAKFLRLFLDQKLYWKTHISNLKLTA